MNDIIEAITDRLRTIRKANLNPATGAAFLTDIGKYVTYGRVEEPVPSKCPAINFAVTNEVQVINYGINARRATLQVEGYQVDRSNNIFTIATNMKEDIDGALLWDEISSTTYERRQILDGLVSELRFVRSDPFQLVTEPPIAGLVMEYNFIYNA